MPVCLSLTQLRPLQPAIQLLCPFEKLLSFVTKSYAAMNADHCFVSGDYRKSPKMHRRNITRQRSRLAPKVLHLPEEKGS